MHTKRTLPNLQSEERGEHMINQLILHKNTNLKLYFSLFIIGMMLTVISTTYAADNKTEITLNVTKIKGKLELDQSIKIQVENLEKWVEDPKNDYSKFILCVDGNALNGLVPSLIDDNKKLRFDLKRTAESRDGWTAILRRKPRGYTRKVSVTVRQQGVKVEGSVEAKLIAIHPVKFWIFVIIFAAAIVLFVWLARKSDIIRDPGPQPIGKGPDVKPHRKPYSLARSQMAFWFFIVVISYVFIWMVTSDLSNLTSSVLALIGISAATGLSSAVVDSSNKQSELKNKLQPHKKKKDDDEDELQKLKSKISMLEAKINATINLAEKKKLEKELTDKKSEMELKNLEIEQTDQKIQEIMKAIQETSENFIIDILSDDKGISFHRFQMFAWTLVLIIIFIAKVYKDLAMPDFDTTLLALMGISGGTYVGFKLPTQQG